MDFIHVVDILQHNRFPFAVATFGIGSCFFYHAKIMNCSSYIQVFQTYFWTN